MNRASCWHVISLIAICAATSARAEDAPDDLKLLAGTWKPAAADLGGNKIDAMVLEKASFVVEGDKYTVTVNDFTEKGSFKIEPTKEPKQLDFFPTEGSNNGKTFLCVYKFDGECLTICYSLDTISRPENFEPLSNTLLLVQYERVKTP
ncbi:MAG TPA: TIGR03067 domain-containing protein [Pirellulaceae bacterium]|nr:TIGR03067 domain-containing protein [Pirellulaceae bacterium]